MQEIKTWFRMLNWKCTDEEYQQALTFFSKERECVREQFEKLSWNAEAYEQEDAIKYLSINLFPWEYIYLIFADKYSSEIHDEQRRFYRHKTGKERWENAAKTIIQIGWPKVNNILLPLFMWLLDPNWPGSELIYDFILALPESVLIGKMNEIAEHPQNYNEVDYADLMALIEQLFHEKGDKGTVLSPYLE